MRVPSFIRAGAIVFFVFAMVAPVLVWASLVGAQELGVARTPVLVQDRVNATFTYSQASAFIGKDQVFVVYVVPLDETIPPPPGLSRWPSPGEAVVSPALLAGSLRQEVGSQFGSVAGVIGKEGLAAANELLVYSRPILAPGEDLGRFAKGFGKGNSGSGVDDDLPKDSLLYTFLLVLMMFPAGLLLAATRASDRNERMGREQVLYTLGARRRWVLWWNIKAQSSSLVAGFVLSGLLLGYLLVFNFQPPMMKWTLSANLLRMQVGPLLAVGLVAAVVGALWLTFPTRPKARPKRSRRRRSDVPGKGLALACLVVSLLVVNLSIWVKSANQVGTLDFDWTMVYLVGVVLVAILFRPLLQWLVWFVSDYIFGWAWRRGNVGSLLASRTAASQVAAKPAVAAGRAAVVVCVIVGFMGGLSEGSAEAVQITDQLKNRFVLAEPRLKADYESAPKLVNISHIFAGLTGKDQGLDFVLTAFYRDHNAGGQKKKEDKVIIGTAAGLAGLGLQPQPKLEAETISRDKRIALGLSRGDFVKVMQIDPATYLATATPLPSHAIFVFFRTDGSDVGIGQLRTQLFATVGPSLRIASAGDSGFLYSAVQVGQLQRFVFSVGLLGMVLLVGAVWVSSLSDLRRERDRLAWVGALGWGRGQFWGAVLRFVLVPSLVAMVATFVMVSVLLLPVTWGQPQLLDSGLVAGVIALLPVVGGVVVCGYLLGRGVGERGRW